MNGIDKSITVREIPVRAISPPRHLQVVAPVRSIPTVVRWLFLLFVFSIPFEDLDMGFSSLSIAKVFGLFFFALYFFYYNPLSRKRSFPAPPAAMLWFLGYVAVYALSGFFLEEIERQFFTRFVTLIQLIALFWIASDLLREERLAKGVLLVFSAAAVLVAIGVILQVPGFVREVALRTTVLGGGSNTVAIVMAVGAVILIGLSLNKGIGNGGRIICAVLALPPLAAIPLTGSRTAVVVFLIGCSPYLLLLRNVKTKVTSIALATVTLAALTYMVGINPLSSSRWERTFMEGKMAGRVKIYGMAADMISERPFFGWGPVEFLLELGKRDRGKLWEQTDPHNLVWHLFLEVGAVGAFPFLVGLWLCLRAAWRARRGNMGNLPLALLLALLSANLAITWVARKPMWLFLALALAAQSMGASNKNQRIPRGNFFPTILFSQSVYGKNENKS